MKPVAENQGCSTRTYWSMAFLPALRLRPDLLAGILDQVLLHVEDEEDAERDDGEAGEDPGDAGVIDRLEPRVLRVLRIVVDLVERPAVEAERVVDADDRVLRVRGGRDGHRGQVGLHLALTLLEE